MSTENFCGVFRLTYADDTYIVLQTKMQANPVNERQSELSIRTQSHIVTADMPLVMSMLLHINDLRLRGFIGLVAYKGNSVALLFRNDPLEPDKVSSTFDGLTSVQHFLQDEIKQQLRSIFQEELAVLVHSMLLRLLDGKKKQSTIRQTDSDQPRMPLQVNANMVCSLSGSRTHTDGRPSFFSHSVLSIAEPQAVHCTTSARDVHSMPGKLPGQARASSGR